MFLEISSPRNTNCFKKRGTDANYRKNMNYNNH
ncbi:unnamed protein product [Spirodela intermedia]|uniref:Uncharacterized protein n=1 Tax=Spirodela intermedia TaxID=51605 RepID=A0A7I8KQX8_SPIIN|nr:unnamed protein product [Spirodela intermedia]